MSGDPTPADPARLQADLAREREEVQRLRDLLIARDAELGAARGRLAEIDARSQRLLGRLRGIPARVLRGSHS